jgi:hypothetical protein
MVLTTGLFVCALLATEIAGALYLANWVRARRKRHNTRPHAHHTSTITHRRLL